MTNAYLPPSDGVKRDVKTGARTIKVHPLFLLLGVYYAFTGELMLFLISTIVAVEHELAHAIAAEKRGFKLNRIVLMPYGAVIDGDLSECPLQSEIAVALAGPICNFLTAAGFVALWWVCPSSYPYTDTACYISFWTAVVNLLPAYPLDGGRVLSAWLHKRVGEKKAVRIRRSVSLLISFALSAAFVALCFKRGFEIGMLLFCVFLLIGAFGSGGDARYEKISFSLKSAFARGVEVKRVAVLESCFVRRAIGFLEKGKYLVLEIYDEREEKRREIGQNELSDLFLLSSYDSRFSDFL